MYAALDEKFRLLVMSSNERSENILVRGLWLVAITKSSIKNLVSSYAHAIARASPSIGAYHCSAERRKRDPAKVIFQPPSQQSGISDEQSQYFCRSQYPIPVGAQASLSMSIKYSHTHLDRTGWGHLWISRKHFEVHRSTWRESSGSVVVWKGASHQ